jgi:Ca2+/H+ antiporter
VRPWLKEAAWKAGVPLAACALLAATWGRQPGWFLASIIALALVAVVIVAVHHAEVVALRVGEPFGTLVLALAVTVRASCALWRSIVWRIVSCAGSLAGALIMICTAVRIGASGLRSSCASVAISSAA